MRKFIMSLLLGGILIGAVYGTAATLNLTGVDDIGFDQEVVNAPGAVSDISFGLATDISVAKNAQITLPTTGSINDTLNFSILSTSCSGTLEFTISTTGASGVRTINLDSNGGGNGPNLTSTGLSVTLIDCVKLTVSETD